MLATLLIAVEVIVLLGSLFDFSRMRLIAGAFFTTTRKLMGAQAVVVIALVVFLQLVGNAQSQQHDNARKSLASRLGSAITGYATNSGGTNTGFTCSASTYCNGIIDPDTSNQPVPGTVATADSGVVYALGTDCSGASASTHYAIYYWAERNGGHSLCLDGR